MTDFPCSRWKTRAKVWLIRSLISPWKCLQLLRSMKHKSHHICLPLQGSSGRPGGYYFVNEWLWPYIDNNFHYFGGAVILDSIMNVQYESNTQTLTPNFKNVSDLFFFVSFHITFFFFNALAYGAARPFWWGLVVVPSQLSRSQCLQRCHLTCLMLFSGAHLWISLAENLVFGLTGSLRAFDDGCNVGGLFIKTNFTRTCIFLPHVVRCVSNWDDMKEEEWKEVTRKSVNL